MDHSRTSAVADRRWRRWLAVVLVLGMGLAACDGGGAGDSAGASQGRSQTATTDSPSPARETLSSAPMFGTPVLIQTRITDAVDHTGVVLGRSVLGESAFCPGGTSTGGSDGAAITTTFRCPGGALTVRYAPTQRSLVQGATWEVVDGTGDFADLRGGGSMVAVFEEDDPDSGQETFTGTLGQ